MKALAIGFENEESETTRKLVETHFSKNELYLYHTNENLTEILTSEGPFSYIILNLDHKTFSAPEMHDKISDIIGLRPFIFIGSINSIKSQLTHELINNHRMNHVLETPIVPLEFKKAMAQCDSWIKNEEFEQSIQDFSKEEMRGLKIKNFFLFEQLPYDVYIELTPNKYGKIISRNKFFSHQLLHSYSKKNIKYLYIKKNEHLKNLELSIKNLILLFKKKQIERSKLVKFQLKSIFYIQEYIRCLTVSDDVNELSHLVAESIMEHALFHVKSLDKILIELDNLQQITFADASIISAYICMYIVNEMQWNADMTKERLILASILQDISLSNEELIKIRTLADPLLKEFSEIEIRQFHDHPIKALEISRLFHGYTEVDFIVRDHHEHPTGDGFPAGLNTSALTTISCIFILATHITSKIARAETADPDLKAIIISMRKIYALGNFKEPVKALTHLFT